MKKLLKVLIEKSNISTDYKSLLANSALIIVGSFVYVIGMNSILIPSKLLTGGVSGVALLLHYLIPEAQFGTMYFLLNIPLAIVGWFFVSRRFILYTIFGIVVFSALASLIYVPLPNISDPILSALFSGVICGAGAGIILRSLGSAGGLDILAVVLNKKYGLRPGTIISISNILIIGGGAYIHDFELSLYSIIFVYTCGKIVDGVLTGFNRRKSLMIISDKHREIADEILSRINRGVTYMKGKGAFSGKNKMIIFTIISLTELPKIKELVYSIDPDAFMVVNDTLEVLGKRHGKLRVF